MSHYSPHLSATFEGYYNRFRLPSGASVCLIVSSVPGAKNRPYMISFTHVTADGRAYWQKEYWSEKWDIRRNGGSRDGYLIEWDDGVFGLEDGKVHWKMKTKEVEFEASQAGRGVPWQPDDPASTPAGILARFPLPIQWHIHTVDSDADFSLSMTEVDLPQSDKQGIAKVHVEKNWAVSFPKSYVWMQARKGNKGLCLAGGSLISGVQAYLVGYQGQGDRFVSFRPPTSTSILGLSLGLYTNVISKKGIIDIDIVGWFSRLKIHGQCDPSTFFSFAAPLADGHDPDYTVQSYASDITVEVYERSWPWSDWIQVEKEDFTQGGMEFGGDAYERHEE
ncbi:uncharacterized protein I303_108700 [Kwoniella dejecticola CBS 10117]|uniref:Uncharacterized protein n=1 Tax=Kwoniella dejecticola CBS 10117 TaxID=1296121 RepID=A0A1A5ZWN2_9TREE|nr:uncharacterized protein I303_06975 [Kwoniella dejecticola CBS 10117]OBR82216.1 hypothetical protein I303_06975 [Kwoniella dejecticola CBS 10117]